MALKHCPRGTCFTDRLAEDREGGGAIVRVRAAQLTHTFHLYTLVTQPYMQDSFSFRLEDYRGHRMWCPGIQMKTWHLTSASRLSPSELSCFHRVNGRMNGTKSRRLRGSRYILEVLCKFAKNQNVYYYY